ncbi:universal stress protein UspA [Natronococcus pandeyae]|uniref:Universal stress protein UspA n=1 Tax=Natronococcus pandeyae TaxID=2055836 RepID=A0A8J8TP30_9EURY|nr:universal stress protein [Natronococcus pandeyae]TYL37341.1 universal stress protein UspA [Natronococcus pandeyae]
MTERILVPVDGSKQARKALERAVETFPEATFTALHVNQIPTYNAEELRVIAEGNWEDRKEKRAAEAFEDVEEIAEANDVEIETAVADGEVSRTIVEHADDYDWIFIGSHGREGISRILLGSVAENVVRRATVPVTVVR